MSEPKTNEKKAEPKTFCGHKTREEMEARDREWSANLKKSAEDWHREHPNGEKPKVF